MAKTSKKREGGAAARRKPPRSARKQGGAKEKKAGAAAARRARPSPEKSALRRAAEEVAAKLSEAGFQALFAGGCVRDMLRGREPRDFDIATDATPRAVQELFHKTYAVGAQFGVVVVLHEGHQFEVATFRVDSTYSDGRHPDAVTFGNAHDDVTRRDFTINGMLFDPRKGKVIDYVGGQEDLKKCLVRTIGDARQRFSEDKLRMLRAVRFSARLGFEIEEETRSAIREMAPQIVVVSQERIKAEIEHILTCGAASSGVMAMRDLGLLHHILPEAASMSEVRLDTESLLEHALKVLGVLGQVEFDLALAALLHCSGGADEKAEEEESTRLTSVAARRLKCSNAQRAAAVWLVLNQFALEEPGERRLSYLKRIFAHEKFKELLALMGAKAQAGCANRRDYEYVRRLHSKLSPQQISPEPLLGGVDLIEMGLKPSELFSVILAGVYDAQLEGALTDRHGAIELALRLARES